MLKSYKWDGWIGWVGPLEDHYYTTTLAIENICGATCICDAVF